MLLRKLVFGLFFSLILISEANSQKGFRFFGSDRTKEQISFKLINNLVVLPISVNGKKLNFILDSGVNKIILFSLSQNDSLDLKNVRKVTLRGLGDGKPLDALVSKNNRLNLKNLISNNETIYVILKDKFDLSGRMGITINGIIGFNLLKDVIAKINYKTQKINFYNPKTFTYRKCKKCEVFPISFNRKKPYIDVKVQLDTIGNNLTDVKMLVDLGGSDAIWLFEHTKENIVTPINYFDDILGEGLSGTIYGKRSRIKKLKMKSFEIKEPTISFLDSTSTLNARRFKERNGSIGANILKRFKAWIDYPNSRLTLKKNASFKGGFNYNMSGLDVVYDGKQLVREHKESVNLATSHYGKSSETFDAKTISLVSSYVYKFKPAYKINNVIKGSPADKAGLLKDDKIINVNGKPTHELKLSDIILKLQEKDNKKIRLVVLRNGEKKKIQFRLRKKV